jgi:hypothetical protein
VQVDVVHPPNGSFDNRDAQQQSMSLSFTSPSSLTFFGSLLTTDIAQPAQNRDQIRHFDSVCWYM